MTVGSGGYSQAFKLAAVERMLAGENVSALARELGLKRKRLYEWRDRFRQHGMDGLRGPGRPKAGQRLPTPVEMRPPSARLRSTGSAGTAELTAARQRIAELERKIGQQQLDLDFFRQALRHFGVSVPSSDAPGATASTPSSKR